jgi:SAM-dependent methyltransferase
MQCNAHCRFTAGNVLNANDLPREQFDFVYASHGVLRWIPNIQLWMTNVANILSPGGFLYLFEIHPLVFRLQSSGLESTELAGDYFDETPVEKTISSTHLGALTTNIPDIVMHVNWKFSTVINSAIQAGLSLNFIHEHAECSYSRKNIIPIRNGTLWRLPGKAPFPLAYSLRATREERDQISKQKAHYAESKK